MILKYTGQLVDKLGGVRSAVNPEPLREMYLRKDLLAMVSFIAKTLSLDNNIRVAWVNRGGPSKAPAWVDIPVVFQMPLYGSEAFRKMTLKLYVRKKFLRQAPFETIVLCFAHELSHFVLNAIGAADKFEFEEEATDLTAMILGYGNFYRIGSIYVKRPSFLKRIIGLWFQLTGTKNKHTYQFGYLNQREINFAVNLIDKLFRP